MRRTKPLQPGQYHTHFHLRSYQDIIQEHVNLEQQMGGFTENETMTRKEKAEYMAEGGRDYMKKKLESS